MPNDLETLNKLNNEIAKLKKKIEELQDVKNLKKLQQEEIKLKNKIIKYSTYNLLDIGNIIAKLMTIFERKKYHCVKSNFLMDCDYCIEPINYNIYDMDVYPLYKIKKEKTLFDSKDKCYLPSSNFYSNNFSNNPKYIQSFIDYLYQKRSNKLLEEINDKELELILQEFLEISIDLQQQRKKEIEEKIKEKIQKQKRREFEKNCMIDRELILNSLVYIINHYEENMKANLEKEQEWSRNSQWSELIGYQILTINYNSRKLIFKAIITSIGCYPDEEYCIGNIDMNKHSNICFFDIKNELSYVLKNSSYLLEFMNNIENMNLEKKNITTENIQQLLANISNDKKARMLKKD